MGCPFGQNSNPENLDLKLNRSFKRRVESSRGGCGLELCQYAFWLCMLLQATTQKSKVEITYFYLVLQRASIAGPNVIVAGDFNESLYGTPALSTFREKGL